MEEPELSASPKRYVKLFPADLLASPAWKKLPRAQQGEALLALLEAALAGEIPERWKRLAELRTVGVPLRTNRVPVASPYAPFRAAWEKAWEENRGEPFVWDGKQSAHLREAYRKAGGDLSLFQVRLASLWTNKRDWYQLNASLWLLSGHWNELGGGPRTAKLQPPPIPRRKPDEVCRYCGWEQSKDGKCVSCQRPWTPDKPAWMAH